MSRTWLDRLKGKTDEVCVWEVGCTIEQDGKSTYRDSKFYHGTFAQVMQHVIAWGGRIEYLHIKRIGTPTVLR